MYGDTMIFRNIEKLGERYHKDYLAARWNKAKLEQDWWEALKFFFSHSFMRGRRDTLSNEYCCFTIVVLEEFLSVSETTDTSHVKLIESRGLFDSRPLYEFKRRIRSKGFRGSSVKNDRFESVSDNNPLISLLSTRMEVTVRWDNRRYKKAVRLDNDEDIMMVLDTLNFIVTKANYNVYKYLRQTIEDEGVKTAYEHLIGIRAVGDKLATFVIRDIGLLNPEIVIASDCKYYFPVDVWVKDVAERIGYDVKDTNHARQVLIQRCEKLGINPLKLASGLWYLGFRSLDLTIEFLNRSDV